MTTNAYTRYQQNQVNTASPGKLLLAAYDGAIKFSQNAAAAMAEGDLNRQSYYVNKTLAIVYELISCLREEVEPQLVSSLRNIYAYMIERLGIANMTQDTAALSEVTQMLSELRATWAEAEKMVSQSAARKEAA